MDIRVPNSVDDKDISKVLRVMVTTSGSSEINNCNALKKPLIISLTESPKKDFN